MTMKTIDRIEDAEIAVEKHGWKWMDVGNRRILTPPEGDERHNWAAKWDEYGIPHYLPNYAQQ